MPSNDSGNGRTVRGTIKRAIWARIPGPIQRRITDRRDRFAEWRYGRPFAGGALLILAGIVIGYVPIQFATELAIIGGVYTVIGLVFAALVFLCGAFALARPDLSRVFGVVGIAMSILSIIGALGGFGIGMLLGIFGGSLCVAYRPPADADTATSPTAAGESQFSWQGDDESQFSWQGDDD